MNDSFDIWVKVRQFRIIPRVILKENFMINLNCLCQQKSCRIQTRIFKGCLHLQFCALRLTCWRVCVKLTRASRTNCSEPQVDILLHRLFWVHCLQQDDNRNVQNRTCGKAFTFFTDERKLSWESLIHLIWINSFPAG